MIPFEILEKFSDGVRVIMLHQRNKEGGRNKGDRYAYKRISTNREEFFKILEEMRKLKEKSDKQLRIYSCVNRRDIEKGILNFKKRQLEADYYDEVGRNNFYIDIENRFISSLMKPNARAETLFLLDIDNKEQERMARTIIQKENIGVVAEYQTKNGKHIITKPFNPKLMPSDIEIKKDGMLLIDF